MTLSMVAAGEGWIPAPARYEPARVALGPFGVRWVSRAGHHDACLLLGSLQHHWRVLQPRLSAAEVHHPDLVPGVCCGGGGVSGVRHPAAVCFHAHGPEAG